jgi:hypothetical protein
MNRCRQGPDCGTVDTWTGVAGRTTMQRACREYGRPYRFSGAEIMGLADKA